MKKLKGKKKENYVNDSNWSGVTLTKHIQFRQDEAWNGLYVR